MGAGNTMTSHELIKQLRATAGCTDDDISDADMLQIIAAELNEYCFYKPEVVLTLAADGITTVSDQPNYAAPDDSLWVIDVAWNPDLTSSEFDGTVDDFYLNLFGGGFNQEFPSELHVIHQRLAEYRRFFAGHWSFVNSEIWLVPPPTQSGDHVAVIYAREKTLADLQAVKDQRFANLVKGAIWIRMGQDMQKQGSWRAGTLAVDNSKIADQMLRSGERLREKMLNQLANSYHAERSGPSLNIPTW
jgi:hypothetical protein